MKKKISPEEALRRYRTIIEGRSKGGKNKWANMTEEERKAYTQKMIEARRSKKERGQIEQTA